MKNIFFLWLIGLSTFLSSCKHNSEKNQEKNNYTLSDSSQTSKKSLGKSEQIIQNAIQKHGGEQYKTLQISFDFREKSYVLRHQENGVFSYERIFKDSTGNVHDVLDNQGFSRKINAQLTQLTEEKSQAYQGSVNSVMYFTLLPYGLDADAVQSRYIGIDTLNGEVYEQVEVTFRQEGGGEDFQDVYLYWFHQQDFTLDYFAYSYEVNEGGIRFREARKRQTVGGVILQNYDNYEVEKGTPLLQIGKLWEADKLKKLSEIKNENIKMLN